MQDLENSKSRRVQGAELVVMGGMTLFFSRFVLWLAPFVLCAFGVYRLLFRRSYKDGIISLAVGILTITLFYGPFRFVEYLLYGVGGFLLVMGAVLMVLPDKDRELS
ncbi:hypothetical protein KKI24_03705 [bacterium]|nr:hypothetical protein [bacterium]